MVDKAFVPEYRTHKAADGFHGTNPGHGGATTAPLYRLPWAQLFVRVISTGSIGAAQAALDTYYELARAARVHEHRQDRQDGPDRAQHRGSRPGVDSTR